jgi:hypothetical protein
VERTRRQPTFLIGTTDSIIVVVIIIIIVIIIITLNLNSKRLRREGLGLLNNNTDMHAICYSKLLSTVLNVIR